MPKLIRVVVVVICAGLIGQTHIAASLPTPNQSVEKVFFPITTYTPDTSLALGGGMIMTWEQRVNEAETYQAMIFPSAFYTLKNQWAVFFLGQYYLTDFDVFIESTTFLLNFPDKFFGIGPNTVSAQEEKYTLKSFRSENAVLWSLAPKIKGGLVGAIEIFSISDLEAGGTLLSTTGRQGGGMVGMGPIVQFDRRDNRFTPRTGSFFEWRSIFYPGISSRFAHSDHTVDSRKFWPIGEKQVLAVQFLHTSQRGVVPFHRLSTMGNRFNMRAYEQGRFRDNNMTAIASEWRFSDLIPIGKRNLGLVLFYEWGAVYPYFSEFSLKNFIPSYGFGFRFPVTKAGNNFRIDFGFGNGSSAFIFRFNEAF